MPTLVTQRLRLRPFQDEDLEDFYAYASHPSVGPGAGWRPHVSRLESLTVLRRLAKLDHQFAITLRENGKVIGNIGLHEDPKRNHEDTRMLGYVLAPPHWGNGYITEAAGEVIRWAFEELGLSVLAAYHYSDNLRSRRVIEKCGFVYEGEMRAASLMFDGTVKNDVCWSITKEAYQNTLHS